MWPHRSTAWSTIRFGASSSVRSTARPAIRSESSTALANSASLASLRPVASTAMPISASLIAQPKPIPPLAPVTIATRISLNRLHQRRLDLMLQYLSRRRSSVGTSQITTCSGTLNRATPLASRKLRRPTTFSPRSGLRVGPAVDVGVGTTTAHARSPVRSSGSRRWRSRRCRDGRPGCPRPPWARCSRRCG